MKLEKININELSNIELNEREMCRLLGGGTPGCCQCGCNYEGSPGGSSKASNDSANNAEGKTSDSGAQPCDCGPSYPTYSNPYLCGGGGFGQDNACIRTP